MKIERLSENQIRCTLNKADLADKELLLTELAYGTEKAKELFRELMVQASNELGFEVDNIPLMIEAIPISPECLILIITKVEDPDELDTRFSRFTRPVVEDDYFDDDELMEFDEEEESRTRGPADLLRSVAELVKDMRPIEDGPRHTDIKKESVDTKQKDTFKIFAFKSLNEVIMSAKLVKDVYDSDNSLYKNPKDSKFYLYLTDNNNSQSEFLQTCNLIGECGVRIRTNYFVPDHIREHHKLLIEDNALQTLADI